MQYLINTTIIGSAVWFILLLIKPFTKKCFSQTWHYYTSLIPLGFMLGAGYIVLPILKLFTCKTPVETFAVVENFNKFISVENLKQNLQPVSTPSANEQPFNFVLLLLAVWVVGMVIFFTVNIIRYNTFKKNILAASIEWTHINEIAKIVTSEHVTSPILIGILNPVIVFPNIEMTKGEIDLILQHEKTHLKSGDLIIKLFALCVNGVFWFNPICYKIKNDLNGLCENACDEKIIKNMDNTARKDYGLVILSVLENNAHTTPSLVTGFACNKKEIFERLTRIINFKKSKKSIVIFSVILVLVLLLVGGVVAFTVKQPTDTPKPFIEFVLDDTNSEDISSQVEDKEAVSSDTQDEPKDVSSDTQDEPKDVSSDTQDEPKDVSSDTQEIIEDTNSTVWPTPTHISLSRGWVEDVHEGVDIPAPLGTSIEATASGVVETAQTGSTGDGNHIIIDHGNGILSLYAHCSELLVDEGDTVEKGQLIAKVGSTGDSTGNHLHFEVTVDGESIDPLLYTTLPNYAYHRW